MTPKKINRAIAEYCGWKDTGYGPIGTLHDPKGCTCFDGTGCQVPNYYNDLNAMHEAEKVRFVCGEDRMTYMEKLADIIERANPNSEGYDARLCCYLTLNATSPQRAEAFLRTVGKWRDDVAAETAKITP
jgi:hypothetical protein